MPENKNENTERFQDIRVLRTDEETDKHYNTECPNCGAFFHTEKNEAWECPQCGWMVV